MVKNYCTIGNLLHDLLHKIDLLCPISPENVQCWPADVVETKWTRQTRAIFKTACFNHSHIPPRGGLSPSYDELVAHTKQTKRATLIALFAIHLISARFKTECELRIAVGAYMVDLRQIQRCPHL